MKTNPPESDQRRRLLIIDNDLAYLKRFCRNLNFDYDIDARTYWPCANELFAGYDILIFGRSSTFASNSFESFLQRVGTGAKVIRLLDSVDDSSAKDAAQENRYFAVIDPQTSMNGIRRLLSEASERPVTQKAGDAISEAVNLLSGLLDLRSSPCIDTSLLAETCQLLARKLRTKLGWPEIVAARVCASGLVLMTPQEQVDIQNLDPRDDRHRSLVNQLFDHSLLLLSKLTRLNPAADLVGVIRHGDGWISPAQRHHMQMATVLKASFYWAFLSARGFLKEKIVTDMQFLFERYSHPLETALATLDCQHSEQLTMELNINELRPGMIAHETLFDQNQNRLVSKGKELNAAIIDNLRQVYEIEDRSLSKVSVVMGSCSQTIES